MRLSLPPISVLRPPAGSVSWLTAASLGLRALIALGAIILCWLLAGVLGQILGWQTSVPPLTLAAPPASDAGAGRSALAQWFVSADPSKPAGSTDGLQLIAVVAGPHGVALIGGAGPSPIAVEVGKEVRAGLRLIEVRPDRAIFEQGGARRELLFPQQGSGTASITSAGTPAPAVTPVNQGAAPVAGPVSSTNVSRGDLLGFAQRGNLADWDKGLTNFPSGGIRVTSVDKQPLIKILNLQDGDVLKRVNDRDLNQLADISLVYHFFTQAQDVNLTILRDGKLQQLHFDIEP